MPLDQLIPADVPPVPTPIERLNSYTTWQTDHPNSPLPGDWVDADYDQSNDAINLLQERLALIQRDDGALLNGVVTGDSLSSDVLTLIDEAEANAVAAAQAAASSAAESAVNAQTAASHAATSATDAANAADAAAAGFNYEQGAQAAQSAAETAASNAQAAAAVMPPLPSAPDAGKVLKLNGAGTAYAFDTALLDDGAGKWDAKGHVIKNGLDAVASNDLTTLSQVQALVAAGGGGGSGSVPPPLAGDVDKVLTVTGAGAWTWLFMTAARISDATAFMRNLLTTVSNAAGLLAAAGGAAAARLINTSGGLQGGGDLSADRTLSLTDTGVAPGAYQRANLTVDAKGRITMAASGSTANDVPTPVSGDANKVLKATGAGAFSWQAFTAAMISDATAYMQGLLTSVADAAGFRAAISVPPTSRVINVTAPITGGGDLSANRTIGHADSGVAAGAYTNANITVDAKGHVTAAANGAGGAQSMDVQTFNGSGTWNKPSGAPKRVRVRIWGAGASGACRATTGNASGGAGGGYSERWYDAATLGAAEPVSIGAGGASVPSSNADGNPGGNSTFSSGSNLLTGWAGGAGHHTAVSAQTAAGGGGGTHEAGANAFATAMGVGGALGGGFGSFSNTNDAANINGGGGGSGRDSSNNSVNGGRAARGGAGGGSASSAAAGDTNGGTSIEGGNGGNGGVAATAGQQPGGGGGGARGGGASGKGGDGRCEVSTFY